MRGGILEHDKCSYHYLWTEFDTHGAPVLRAGLHGDPVIIKDAYGNETTLKQVSVCAPYKMLGTFKCPRLAQRHQTEVIEKRAQSLVCILAISSCKGQAAWMYYSSVFFNSVGYPLAVS